MRLNDLTIAFICTVSLDLLSLEALLLVSSWMNDASINRPFLIFPANWISYLESNKRQWE